MAILCLKVVVGQGEAPEMGLKYNGKYNGTTLNTFILSYFKHCKSSPSLKCLYKSLVFHASFPTTKLRRFQQTVILLYLQQNYYNILQKAMKSNYFEKQDKKKLPKLLYGCYCKFTSTSCTETLIQLFIHLMIFGCFL